MVRGPTTYGVTSTSLRPFDWQVSRSPDRLNMRLSVSVTSVHFALPVCMNIGCTGTGVGSRVSECPVGWPSNTSLRLDSWTSDSADVHGTVARQNTRRSGGHFGKFDCPCWSLDRPLGWRHCRYTGTARECTPACTSTVRLANDTRRCA